MKSIWKNIELGMKSLHLLSYLISIVISIGVGSVFKIKHKINNLLYIPTV